MKKKGQAWSGWLIGGVFAIAIVGLLSAFVLQIMGEVRDDMKTGAAGCNATAVTSCGSDYNATVEAVSGISAITSKLGLIALVVVAGILIGLLFYFFKGKMGA